MPQKWCHRKTCISRRRRLITKRNANYRKGMKKTCTQETNYHKLLYRTHKPPESQDNNGEIGSNQKQETHKLPQRCANYCRKTKNHDVDVTKRHKTSTDNTNASLVDVLWGVDEGSSEDGDGLYMFKLLLNLPDSCLPGSKGCNSNRVQQETQTFMFVWSCVQRIRPAAGTGNF